MGSTKDMHILKEATDTETGLAVFEFTDKYSVFDYGKMPDMIEGKGAALCAMSVYNFRELEKLGLKTYLIESPKLNELKFHLFQKQAKQNAMIPLEIIFRDVLGEESSVFKRLQRGETTYPDLGLDHEPQPGEKLARPIIDYSTKYETTDRYFRNKTEVMEYAGLSNEQMEKLERQALIINEFLRKRAGELGWIHIDGKVEAARNVQGEVIWVDSLGTLDEDRFEFKGLRLSKQILRDYYRKTSWRKELEKAQEQGIPKEQWPVPKRLPKELVEFVSNMYKAAANAWTNRKIFDVKDLNTLIDEDYKQLREKEVI